MDILLKSLNALWQVLLVGLLLGAGLPALFALGMRSLQHGRTPDADGTVAIGHTSTVSKVGAAAAFSVVGLAVVFGIVVIVFGDQLFG